ncbi:hypothetical protein LAZ67_19001368 [Cordylochernes scorpioides]|uniref:Transposase Tc1-like domain-containing protein n=1 Tax=Cordylochernes scorpioides TaxID=51811 RepID=A0ABY6LHM7_9ARAC|nr:hypothetical protein LAZ67_19001368 [Cordylochernes scorpioides]
MPGHRKRRQFKQTDAFTRGMVIGLKRAGWSIRQIAADTHLGASTVHRLWRRWLEQGNVAIYRNVGATRVTSARVDRRILRQAVAAPQATCTAILQHVQDTLDHSISTRTISRRLLANGLHSCRPLRRLPLTPPNRRQRLEWCRARSTWMTEWHRVVFSDESRFCLSSDSRRVRVWRRRGERSNPAAIVERPTVRLRGIMVWGAIAYDSRSPLLRIQGTMTAQRYVDDVLRPVILPYLQGYPMPFISRITPDRTLLALANKLCKMYRCFPGHRTLLISHQSKDELWQMVEREWRAIPQDAIRTLIDSLPRRVAACIAVLLGVARAILEETSSLERVLGAVMTRAGQILDCSSCRIFLRDQEMRNDALRIAGTLNSQLYISEVLVPFVLPYLQDLLTAIFHQNNAQPYVARIVERFFVNRQIELLPWPARFRDLWPIESMLSMVAQRLTQITSPAATPDQLWQRVEAAWSAVPQEHIQSLFESMPRRVAAVISNNGGYFGY